jgi:hypothetical protein
MINVNEVNVNEVNINEVNVNEVNSTSNIEYEHDSCIICMRKKTKNIKDIQNLIKTCDCFFYVHEDCIIACINNNPRCPYCTKFLSFSQQQPSPPAYNLQTPPEYTRQSSTVYVNNDIDFPGYNAIIIDNTLCNTSRKFSCIMYIFILIACAVFFSRK